MPYVPAKVQVNRYVPSAKDEKNTNQFLSSELQQIVDQKIKELSNDRQVESPPNNSYPPATEEDKIWLKSEISKRLESSSKFDLSLPFDQRGKLYRYREELRNLSDKLGSNWTRASVVFPELSFNT